MAAAHGYLPQMRTAVAYPSTSPAPWVKIVSMAVLLELTVTPATQDQFYELDAKVGQSMQQAGGPPEGLMSHAVYPEGEGFVIAESGLTGQDAVVRQVWSFARP